MLIQRPDRCDVFEAMHPFHSKCNAKKCTCNKSDEIQHVCVAKTVGLHHFVFSSTERNLECNIQIFTVYMKYF